MLPYEEDIINVIDNAFKSGFNIPKYYFEKDYDNVKDSIEGEIYFCDPMYFVKPKGIEFSYILFWNGHRFKGGYVAINNNYIGLQRGPRSRNGSTLFASHILDLKKCFKRYTGSEPTWICHSFIMDEKGKIFYWGTDSVDNYVEQIETLTGEGIAELEEFYINDGNTVKPKGFVSSIVVYDADSDAFICCGDLADSITKSWNLLYEKADTLKKNFWFITGVESYVRMAFAKLNVAEKLK